MTQELYHFANIRELLTQGFSDQQLRDLCFDVPGFRPVFNAIGAGTDKGTIISKLLEHSEKTLQVDILLALARDLNPARYELHQPYYLTDPASALQNTIAGLARQSSAPSIKASSISFVDWFRSKWTIALLVAAGIMIVLWILFRPPPPSPQTSCDKYGVKIVSPVQGDVTPPVHVSGVFDEIPDGSAIYVSNAYRGAEVSDYRPATRATIDRQKKIWYSDVGYIGGKGGSPDIVALLAGADGQILIEYHFKVGDETKIWPAITKLPQDTLECDSVRVTIR
jgi:hypothetical protein